MNKSTRSNNRRLSEEDVLKQLGIPDFRHMTKNRIISFMSMIPDMDRETALAAIEQFPAFSKFAVSMMEICKAQVQAVNQSNNSSMKACADAHLTAIKSLSTLLANDTLSEADKVRVAEMLVDLVHSLDSKDTENKAFLEQLFQKAGYLLLFFGLVGASILGVRAGGVVKAIK